MTKRPSAFRDLFGFSALAASLSAGYGVLFTLVGDYRDAYGIGETALGLIIGGGFIAEFVAMILIAPLGDRGRARSVIWAGVALNIVGLLIMAVSATAWILAAGRLLSGLATGAVHPVLRRVVVLRDPANMGRNLGHLISASVFGFAAGPAISAVLAEPFGLAAPFLAVAALAAASTVVMARSGEIPSDEAAADRAQAEVQPRLALDLLTSRPLVGALCFGAATYAMIGGFDVLWDVVHEDLGTPTWLANIGISIFALPLIVLSPIGGRLAQTYGPFRVGGLGLMAASVFMTSYGLLPTGVHIVSVTMLHALTDGLTIAATGIAIAITAPDDRQAGAQGLLGAAQALTAGLVAPAIGAVYENQGRFPAYASISATMIVLVAIGTVLAWSVIARSGHRRRGAAATAGSV